MQTSTLILDTSVVVAYCLGSGKTHTNDVIHLLKTHEAEALATQEMFDEIDHVFLKASVQRVLQPRKRLAHEFLKWYKGICLIVLPTAIELEVTSRDADDNKFLVVADMTHAHYLLSHDEDLLIVKKYKNTQILSPASFISLIRSA